MWLHSYTMWNTLLIVRWQAGSALAQKWSMLKMLLGVGVFLGHQTDHLCTDVCFECKSWVTSHMALSGLRKVPYTVPTGWFTVWLMAQCAMSLLLHRAPSLPISDKSNLKSAWCRSCSPLSHANSILHTLHVVSMLCLTPEPSLIHSNTSWSFIHERRASPRLQHFVTSADSLCPNWSDPQQL